MKTVVLGPNPEIDAMIARRRSLGQDRLDEVWEGEYHVAPEPTVGHALVDHALAMLLAPYAAAAGLHGSTAFNLGDGPTDYRVPDGGYHRDTPAGTWIPTAAIVVEIVSPDDETYAKFGFYAARGVEEIIVADPVNRLVQCFLRAGAGYLPSAASELLGVAAAELTAGIDWP
jgi:Uma2 family endonuclease